MAEGGCEPPLDDFNLQTLGIMNRNVHQRRVAALLTPSDFESAGGSNQGSSSVDTFKLLSSGRLKGPDVLTLDIHSRLKRADHRQKEREKYNFW